MTTRLAQVAHQLEARWSKDPAYLACIKIIRFIEQSDPQKSRMLTYQAVADIVGSQRHTEEMDRALALLTGRFQVLALHFVFIDDEGERHYLDDEEEKAFINEGVFADPESGEEVAEPSTHLFPYYEARTEDLLQEVGR